MTLNHFQQIVLMLANVTSVRYWKHWNYPYRSPWEMAVKVYRTNGFNPTDEKLEEDMRDHGLTYDRRNFVFTAVRTNEDGTPYS